MKKLKVCIFLLFIGYNLSAQDATEVYLFDLIQGDSIITIDNPINISDNKGYDNQPSFLNDDSGVLFASTRDGQTDIAVYNIENNERTWLTSTTGSEYSPIQTPQKKYFSAIKLDEDGKQLLWLYPFNRKKAKILIENLTVGYHTWFNKKTIVSFVLGDPATLEVSNLKYKIKYPIDKNIGRSLHKIPNTELISFISFEHEVPEIYSINPLNSEKHYLADALEGSQDMAWTPNGTMIMGKDDKLYKLKPGEDKDWIEFASLSRLNLSGISRIAVSSLGTKIAIVVNENSMDQEATNN